jgi:hypothetical protein
LVRQASGAAAVVVHHSGYERGHPRGATAISVAVDVALATRKSGETLTLTVSKAKDGEEGRRIVIKPERIYMHDFLVLRFDHVVGDDDDEPPQLVQLAPSARTCLNHLGRLLDG